MTMPYYVAPEQVMKDRADYARNVDGGVAAPATDVDHPLSWLRCCGFQRGVTEWDDNPVDLPLHREPSLAQRTVPFCNLPGVVSQHGSLVKCGWRESVGD